MKSENENSRNIDFLYEIGSLKNVSRLWQQILGTPVSNNIEHSFRVMMIALVIARIEKRGDEEKIMKMALFHDVCESRSVDIAFVHRNYVDRQEDKSVKDQLMGTVFEGDIEELLNEYKERKSIESQIVKDADNLECDFELKELEKKGSKTAEKFQQTNRPDVAKKLFTDSAKKLWQQIQDSDPDHWHLDLNHNWAKSDGFNK